MREFLINSNDAGQRLDRFVFKAVPLLPGPLVQKYIRIKRIKVGGRGASRDYKLKPGDVVEMYVNDEFFACSGCQGDGSLDNRGDVKRTVPLTTPLSIIYEDSNILLIDKAAGILCHSADANDSGTLISDIRSYLYQKGEWRPHEESTFAPALCNRIDRNTSGIVIAAKNAQSLRIINEKIKLGEIDKLYLAAVHGVPDPPSGQLEGYLSKDAAENRAYISRQPCAGSKHAAMEYKTLAAEDGLALLECRLITGRTHQIRAQLNDIGHPLLGDIKYGGQRINKPYGENRQALCAYKLVFSFITDAGILSYLAGKAFQVNNAPFIEKYFKSIDI